MRAVLYVSVRKTKDGNNKSRLSLSEAHIRVQTGLRGNCHGVVVEILEEKSGGSCLSSGESEASFKSQIVNF